MNKRNAALEALTKAAPASNVVELKAEEPVAEAPPRPARTSRTVANTAARSMLYLPPKVKRKFKEIAFHEDRKEHDIYMDALREYLEKRGHKGLL
jgi:hypothetical protein